MQVEDAEQGWGGVMQLKRKVYTCELGKSYRKGCVGVRMTHRASRIIFDVYVESRASMERQDVRDPSMRGRGEEV